MMNFRQRQMMQNMSVLVSHGWMFKNVKNVMSLTITPIMPITMIQAQQMIIITTLMNMNHLMLIFAPQCLNQDVPMQEPRDLRDPR